MQLINSNLQQAINAFQTSDYKKADKICLQLLKVAPKHPDVLHLLAISAKQQNDLVKAENYFKSSLLVNNNQPIVLTNYANLLVNIGNLEQANSSYEKAISLSPNNIDALYNWATLLNQMGKTDKAIEKLNQAIAINNKNPLFFNLLGNCFKKIEQYSDALEAYDNALKISPSNFYALHNKGVVLRNTQKPQQAIDCYLTIYESGKNIPEFLFNLACAYYDLGEFNNVESYLKKAISINPNYTEAHETLNKFYWEHSRKDDFLSSYKNAIANSKQSAELRYSYASYLIMAQMEDKAQEVLEKAIKDLGNQPEFTHALAILIGKKGLYDKSIQLLNDAISLYPKNTRYRIDIANILIQQGDYHEALSHIELASSLEPLNQEIWAFKGTCWRLLNDEREHWLNNYDRFIQAKRLDTPEGYDNFEHFIHEYRAALNKMHMTINQPLDQSVRGGSQTVGNLLLEPLKVIQDYRKVLNKRAQEYLSSLPEDPKHPFLNRTTGQFKFSGCWSVRLKSNGFHTNHVHPQGWLSGPTYISIPKSISVNDPRKSGWVKFGETSMKLGEREKISLEVCPQPGLCVFFPSYMWHGTNAFQSSEYRMTSPCDIMPA